jgi:transposase
MGGRPEGGADRCGDMGYATTNGIELRIFCPAVKDMWVARRKIIDIVEAVLYRFRTGCPWRDLPERFGYWKAVHQRFGRWAKSGVFERIFKLLASDHDNEYMMIDATIVRAHQHSAGARKKTARKPSANRAED